MNTADNMRDEHWKWRYEMAEEIAACIDPEFFGVKAFYVFGSTKNACAGPMSDIDLIIHVEDSPVKNDRLRLWLDGWSRCLDAVNSARTGYKTEELLDVHLITDYDIEQKTSFAVKIGAVTDPARRLPLGSMRDNG